MIPRSCHQLLGRGIIAVLPPFNFLTLHYAYFLATPLICSVIFWGSSTPSRSLGYVDSLFMCVSAMTGAGLNTVDLSALNSFQQAILFALLFLGHAILISITVLFVRRSAFQAKFKGISIERARKRLSLHMPGHGIPLDSINENVIVEEHQPAKSDDVGHDGKGSGTAEVTATESNGELLNDDPSQWAEDDQVTLSHMRARQHHRHRVFPMVGVGARPDLNNHPRDVAPRLPQADEDELPAFKGFIKGTQKYFASKGFIARNSQFHGLTPEERDKLGGVEYKAITFLLVIVTLYWVLFVLCGIIGMGTWLAVNHPDIARKNGLSPFWTGAFFAVSAFVNSGMSLLDANMAAFQTNAYPLLTMSLLILAGNTLYPCFLRFIIWGLRCCVPNSPSWASWKVTFDFILDHPRRVYTNLFPKRHTWYLLGTIIILNAIDWAGFEVLSLGLKEIEDLPKGYRVLDGLFQASAVRSGGFYVVTISDLRQGLLVLYVLMMYVSAYPVLVAMRNTNVYEERSLGIYAHDNTDDEQDGQSSPNMFIQLVRHHILRRQDVSTPEASRSYFVHQQLRSQLSHDLWWIALAVLLIAIAESSNFSRMPVAYSTFNIIFEVVSAYGCVGISVGFPGSNASFCSAWHPISKLILAAVTLRGRHRGLPVAIDRAVMLPSESLEWAEEEDAAMRREQSRAWGCDKMPVGSV
ncbi:putative potassium transporter [Aspergillus heteromorphus CBS 117.55]|uniref:Putative potassium transporter n=1 Tax=Aspergillus heteromorphus CBS 117.55 TaxID=1448321 RepID=A0A317WXD5_9EURO|nr:putative potassium transporter [Aspergillus heteromorphus CBS 117.55]PWY89992.1 putative potassium transporter [Aspergillus heteromorphus CBS 117.55]